MRLSKILTTIGLAIAAVVAPVAATAGEAQAPAPSREAQAPETAQVKVHAGGIVIEVTAEEPVHVVIYALTGQVVKQLDAPSGQTVVDLPAGYYIVRAGHSTVKVAVK